MQTNDEKLKKMMADLFEVNMVHINEMSSVDSIEKWDSLNHMKLVLGLESAFNVTLTEEQSVEIISFPLIKEVLKEHGVKFN